MSAEKYEKWVAISTILGTVLGAAGIAIATFSLNYTIELEKTKIRPYLSFQFSDTQDTDILVVKNTGLGPAMVTSIEIKTPELTIDISSAENRNNYSSDMMKYLGLAGFSNGDTKQKLALRTIPAGNIVGVGESITLIAHLGYQKEKEFSNYEITERLYKFLEKGNIVARYCSFDEKECFSSAAK